MTNPDALEGRISHWLEQKEAGTHYPDRLLTATLEQTRALRQARSRSGVSLRIVRSLRSVAGAGAIGTAIVLAGVLALNFGGIGGTQSPAASGGAEASPTEGVAGRIPCRRPAGGIVLGCSRDGTKVLIQKGRENLFIVHPDGSETQVTEQLSGINRFSGSSRPAGAAISPDGSRVVFAGLTTTDGRSCHHGALFAVDADGGPAETLWESQAAADGGIVRYPTFSPDGTRIAFSDGYCDSNHSVWLMNADGTEAHEILTPRDTEPSADVYGVGLGGAHVYGLAWSAAGDRIAVRLDAAILTFTASGGDLQRSSLGTVYCWSGLPPTGC